MNGKRGVSCDADSDFVPPSRKRLSLSRSRSDPSPQGPQSGEPSVGTSERISKVKLMAVATVPATTASLGQCTSLNDTDTAHQHREPRQCTNGHGNVEVTGEHGEKDSTSGVHVIADELTTCAFCPGCQVPLVSRTEDWCNRHVSDCLDFPSRSTEECPSGAKCTFSLPSHFRKFSHSSLASLRSNTASDDAASPENAAPPDSAASAPVAVAVAVAVVGAALPHSDEVKVIGPLPAPVAITRTASVNGLRQAASQLLPSRDSAGSSLGAHATLSLPSQSLESPSKPLAPTVQTNLASFFGLKPSEKAATLPKTKPRPVYGGMHPSALPSNPIHSPSAASLPGRAANRRATGGGVASRASDEPDGAVASAVGGKRQRKQCPFYKHIPGTCFTVDAFCYGSIDGCKAYFLSHFHSDHYGGLTKSFSHPIYCSKSTGNLCVNQLRVSQDRIHTLDMNQTTNVHGVLVTPVDANHCPGSVMFVFQLPDGRTLLHTGDFRSAKSVIQNPHLRGLKYDTIYLDTTYLDPKYDFPPQDACVEFAVRKAKEAVATNPRTLIVSGTYSIGKERVFLAVAEALKSKVAVTSKKKAILDQLEWPELTSRLTTNWSEAQVHVLSMMQISFKGMAEHLQQHAGQYNCIVGFRPTGWTQSNKTTITSAGAAMPEILPSFRDGMILYGIPYSEHSSFSELKRFVQHFRPGFIQPTVNVGSAASRDSMQRYFNQWLST